MNKFTKRVKAILLASAVVVSTVAMSLTSVQTVKAADKVQRPDEVKVTVSAAEYKAGGQFNITPEFEGTADKIIYEVYYSNASYDAYMDKAFNYDRYRYYGMYYDYVNHRFVFPTYYNYSYWYYNYINNNNLYPYYYYYYDKEFNLGARAFTLVSDELESGVTSTFDIPEYAYGVYTVRVIVENEAGCSSARALNSIYVKNDSYSELIRMGYPRVPYYYYN